MQTTSCCITLHNEVLENPGPWTAVYTILFKCYDLWECAGFPFLRLRMYSVEVWWWWWSHLSSLVHLQPHGTKGSWCISCTFFTKLNFILCRDEGLKMKLAKTIYFQNCSIMDYKCSVKFLIHFIEHIVHTGPIIINFITRLLKYYDFKSINKIYNFYYLKWL